MGLDHSKASGKGSGDVDTGHDGADHAETKITTADRTAAEKEKGSLDRKSDIVYVLRQSLALGQVF